MSEQPNTQRDEMAQKRLLKANNVQRRRFEKMAEQVTSRAHNAQSAARNDQRRLIYKQVVEETMGHDLKALLEIRSQIQAHKREIERLRTEAYEPVRRRLVKRGVSAGNYDADRYRNGPLVEFYLKPPVTDEKSEDVCQQVIGNPMVQGNLMDCPNNPPYAEYQRRCQSVDEKRNELALDIEELNAQIWALVTTEEIVEAIRAFKEKWNG